MSSHQFYATTPPGLEALLADELRQLGARDPRQGRAGVTFTGPLESAYRACLWSRLSNRILLSLGDFLARDGDELYRGALGFEWSAHLNIESTFAVDAHCAHSRLTHSKYVALRIKDAIADYFRERIGARPSVDRERPDVRINVYVFRDRVRLSLDLSGTSLHQRGYRHRDGGAPLKENLAAGILQHAGWPAIAAADGGFFDPMCGSGTLVIEAGLMAANIAPGLQRNYFGFVGWRQHNAASWQSLLDAAQRARDKGLKNLPPLRASDRDAGAVELARKNIARAGLADHVVLECEEISRVQPKPGEPSGLLLANPPYGVRMDAKDLPHIYTDLGGAFDRFSSWQPAVFTGNAPLLHRIRRPKLRAVSLRNGALECRLQLYRTDVSTPSKRFDTVRKSAPCIDEQAASAFANRVRKNHRGLRKWAERNTIRGFRIYDADIPDYNAAIDVFDCCDGVRRVHLQEYAAPRHIDGARSEQRLHEMLNKLPEVLNCEADNVYGKTRRRQRGKLQYEKLADQNQFHTVAEGGHRFLINFTDFQDCGLFLDHRNVRNRVAQLSGGRRFLNLFSYTGSASVYARAAGATRVVSVDLSRTYLDWAQRNFALNQLDLHDCEFAHADCIEWLSKASRDEEFDVILIDAPTFSNSKRTETDWDVQKRHADLLRTAMAKLSPGGTLLFSCNKRRFQLDPALANEYHCVELTRETVPADFSRTPQIHRCWEITFERE